MLLLDSSTLLSPQQAFCVLQRRGWTEADRGRWKKERQGSLCCWLVPLCQTFGSTSFTLPDSGCFQKHSIFNSSWSIHLNRLPPLVQKFIWLNSSFTFINYCFKMNVEFRYRQFILFLYVLCMGGFIHFHFVTLNRITVQSSYWGWWQNNNKCFCLFYRASVEYSHTWMHKRHSAQVSSLEHIFI